MEHEARCFGPRKKRIMVTFRIIGHNTSKSMKLDISKDDAMDMSKAIVLAADGYVYIKLYTDDDKGYNAIGTVGGKIEVLHKD